MKIQLPWKVRIQSAHAAITRHRGGRLSQTTNRYFETKEIALVKYPGCKPIYAPGEAFTNDKT